MCNTVSGDDEPSSSCRWRGFQKEEEVGRPWVGDMLSKSKDRQGVHCGWSSVSEGESGRKWGQWGSQGTILCGFGLHSNCDGNPLERSKHGSDIIFYCTENSFMNYFLLRELLRGLAENLWFSRNLKFLADISYISGPKLVARTLECVPRFVHSFLRDLG